MDGDEACYLVSCDARSDIRNLFDQAGAPRSNPSQAPSTKSTRRGALTLAFNDRRPTTARGHDDEHEDQKDRNDTPISIQIGLAHQSPPPSLMSMFTSSVPLGC
jgi:hypothetical protein